MIHRKNWVSLLLGTTLLTASALADITPQPQMTFPLGTAGIVNTEWDGAPNRVYFFQWSLDLTDWQYAPFMEFGEGIKSLGLAADAEKFFARLFTNDDPAITTLEQAMAADFDGDGLSNIYEVTYGYDPMVFTNASGLDVDGDGSTNLTEQIQGRNLVKKNHPVVGLRITALDRKSVV